MVSATPEDKSAAGRTLLAWQRLKKSVLDSEPQDLVKFAVFAVCMLLVYVQECLNKLQDPPITTHSMLSLNETMNLPALTICREPPYNRKVYPKYNFTNLRIDPHKQTSVWSTFPYDKYSQKDFWDEAIYPSTGITTFSLNSLSTNVERSSSFHLTNGRCQTFKPQLSLGTVGKQFGYSFTFYHDLYGYDSVMEEIDPGWHVFLHESRENFTENTHILDSRQDHMFLHAGEELEVRLDALQFQMLRNCNQLANYSVSQCEHQCWLQEMDQELKCIGPWLYPLDKRLCNTYAEMRELLKTTQKMSFKKDCCQRPCATIQYKAYVVMRKQMPDARKKFSQLHFYFSSKAILTMFESEGYDWNLFLADLGGSVGFLLGLSVIGIIGVLEQLTKLLVGRKKEKKTVENEKPWKYSADTKSRSSTVSQTSTLVATFDRY